MDKLRYRFKEKEMKKKDILPSALKVLLEETMNGLKERFRELNQELGDVTSKMSSINILLEREERPLIVEKETVTAIADDREEVMGVKILRNKNGRKSTREVVLNFLNKNKVDGNIWLRPSEIMRSVEHNGHKFKMKNKVGSVTTVLKTLVRDNLVMNARTKDGVFKYRIE